MADITGGFVGDPTPVPLTQPVPVPYTQPAAAPTLSPADQSAKSIISATLGQYGLQGLAEWAWGQYTGGAAIEQIMLDIRDRPEYHSRFPAMKQLADRGHALSESQYIQLEQSYSQIMHAAGVPEGFYDQPDDFTKFLTNNVAPTELQSRVQDAQTAIYTNPAIAEQLNGLYGSGAAPGQILAYFIDPDRAEPLIARQLAAATVATAGKASGYGQISREDAELIANQGLSQGALTEKFQQLGLQAGATRDKVGPHEDRDPALMSSHDLLAAALEGDANAQKHLLQLQQQRKDDELGGGQFIEAKPGAGLTGVGTQASAR